MGEERQLEGAPQAVDIRIEREIRGLDQNLESTLAVRDGFDDLAHELGAGTEVVDERERAHPERGGQAAKGQCREGLVDQIVHDLLEKGRLSIGVRLARHQINITHHSYNGCFYNKY